MIKDWVLVYSSTQMHKIQLLKHLLNSYGLESIVLNQQDSIYAEENNPGNDTLSVFKEPVVADNSNRESPEEEREEFIEEENVDVIHAKKIISEARL